MSSAPLNWLSGRLQHRQVAVFLAGASFACVAFPLMRKLATHFNATSLFAWYHSDRLISSSKYDSNSGDEDRVLFFPDTGLVNNVLSGEAESQIRASTSLVHMLDALQSASRSLDVCMYVLTCAPLVEHMIMAKERGVRVRVLLDASMVGVDGSCIGQLRKNNVCVRVYAAPGGGMLHHKFAVCDAREGEGVVMTGSLNWTWTGVLSNRENVLISKSKTLVRQYDEKFGELWEQA